MFTVIPCIIKKLHKVVVFVVFLVLKLSQEIIVLLLLLLCPCCLKSTESFTNEYCRISDEQESPRLISYIDTFICLNASIYFITD